MPSRLELTLTSHELFVVEPDSPATGKAIRVEVTPDDQPSFFVLARQVKIFSKENGMNYYRVLVRDERRPEDTIFSVGINSHAGRKEPRSEEKVKELVAKLVAKRKITRFWKSPELPYCVALTSSGKGLVMPQRDHASWGDFQVQPWDEDQFWQWNTEEFHAFCQRLVTNPQSELNVFLKWQQLSPSEQTSLATTCERGDWEQLKRLFVWVLQLVVYHFGLQLKFGPGPGFYWVFTREIPSVYDCPAVFFARRWQEAIFGIARPNFWNLPPTLHWPSSDNWIFYEAPTAHEFMEAQLGLREFLRPHLSGGEIEALFIP